MLLDDIVTIEKGGSPLINAGNNMFPLPNECIVLAKLGHPSQDQQREILAVLDEFLDVFSDSPGLCNLIMHKIPDSIEFKPKRSHAYQVPERLKPEVD